MGGYTICQYYFLKKETNQYSVHTNNLINKSLVSTGTIMFFSVNKRKNKANKTGIIIFFQLHVSKKR